MCSEDYHSQIQMPATSASGAHKRSRDELRILDRWAPGAGVPCYSFGPIEEREKTERLFKTSLLFLELEVVFPFEVPVSLDSANVD